MLGLLTHGRHPSPILLLVTLMVVSVLDKSASSLHPCPETACVWFVSGMVLEVAEGAAGVAPGRSFNKSLLAPS